MFTDLISKIQNLFQQSFPLSIVVKFLIPAHQSPFQFISEANYLQKNMMNIICSSLTYPCNCSIRRIFSIANFVSSGLRSIWLRTSWSSSFSLLFSSTKYESTVSFPSTSDSSLWILSSLKRSIIFPLCVFCSRCCTCRLDHLCCYLQKDKPSRSGVHQSNCKVQIQRWVNHFCSIFPVGFQNN